MPAPKLRQDTVRKLPYVGPGGKHQCIYWDTDFESFDKRDSDKLFGMFQRLPGTDEFDGSGIGLSIVQRVIERHGGRNWAESEVRQRRDIHFQPGVCVRQVLRYALSLTGWYIGRGYSGNEMT